MRIFVFVASVLIALMIIGLPASAWWNDTHGALAEKVCRDFNCSCIEDIAEWSNIPDALFKDMINHHDYDTNKDCPESRYWRCPTENDFKASRKVQEFLDSAEQKEGCSAWKDIAIASHYFFDTKVFWHNVQDEDYFECHKGFEQQVNEHFLNKDTDWTVCTCGICVSYDEFEPWVLEFEEKIGFLDKVYETPLIVENEKDNTFIGNIIESFKDIIYRILRAVS